MSKQHELNSYIQQLHQRLRLGKSLRGIAIFTGTALAATLLLVLILNAYAFPHRGLISARIVLALMLVAAALLGLILPLLRLTRHRSVTSAESLHPEFQQRLTTFQEREAEGPDHISDPFIELLAADTLAVAEHAPPKKILPNNALYAFSGIGLACLIVLVLLITAGPGYLGYGASLLWTGPKHNATPLYDIRILPGDVAVRRNSDQLIIAQVIGLHPDKVRLYARYQSALIKFGKDAAWEPVAMQPQPDAIGGANYQFLFTGLPEDVEYYVAAGPITSPHYKVRVLDLPSVKQIQVTYHYPKWTGISPVADNEGGDLRAIEGTDAELSIQTDRPLHDGLLVLDNGQPLHLTGGDGDLYKTSIHMEKDGAYHIAAVDQGQLVRLSEDYFIATNKANPPEIVIDHPAQDYRASPIEEVTIGVKASDDFALNHVALHYSVNGGPEKTVDMLSKPGAKESTGSTTLALEDYKLVPGDVISIYATAADGHSDARTDISFIQADPFEREFSQSQQSGGGGGGGGQGVQNDISKREKELIAETWKHQNDKTATPKESTDAAAFLADAQLKLRQQALALSARMQSRDLSSANEEFNSFEKDMLLAANAMTPSADKLMQMHWQEAMPNEQKALQYLLRADATFRQIELAFGQRGGGGGGGGGSAGRDLASLFDLEMDTEKNQYETAQTGSPEEEKAKAVDDALQKLDALAHRQEELAQQHNATPNFQDRWQQEMLRREAEQLQRQMEQMAQQSQQGQQGQSSQQSQQSPSASGSQQSQSQQSPSQSQSQPASSANSSSQQNQSGRNSTPNSTDIRVQEALNRLRQANDEMKRTAGPQPNQEAAQRAADQLRQATSLLGGVQQQQSSGQLSSLANDADRLSMEEHSQADRIRNLSSEINADGQLAPPTQQQYEARLKERDQLAQDRQHLSDDLAQLQRNLRNAARQLAPTQPGASSKLRDALSGIDQNDLTNLTQRTADWLRRGIDPNSNGTEASISNSLQKLSDQLHQAQAGVDSSNPQNGQRNGRHPSSDSQGQQQAALDQLQRLRNNLQSQLQRGNPNAPTSQQNVQQRQAGQPGQQAPAGQNQGQQQSGQLSRNQSQQGQGSQGQGQAAQRGQAGQGQQAGRGGNQNSQTLGGRIGDLAKNTNNGGDIGNRTDNSGGTGSAWNNIDTGNQHFGPRNPNQPGPSINPPAAESERAYNDNLAQLNQLRHLAQADPAALKEVQDLIRAMQQLDPHRFPGNPALVEQLHTQVLNDVDKLELQLRHDADSASQDQVRTGKPANVPPGYQEAVADYYRRLSSTTK